jgi:hypothetical protein
VEALGGTFPQALAWLRVKAVARLRQALAAAVAAIEVREYWAEGCATAAAAVKGWQCGRGGTCYTSGKPEGCAGLLQWMAANQLAAEARRCACPPPAH